MDAQNSIRMNSSCPFLFQKPSTENKIEKKNYTGRWRVQGSQRKRPSPQSTASWLTNEQTHPETQPMSRPRSEAAAAEPENHAMKDDLFSNAVFSRPRITTGFDSLWGR